MTLSSLKYDTLSLARPYAHVLLVTMDRPDVGNAMNTQMGLDYIDLFERFQVDAMSVRCIVLTGAGDKIFCAGGDLKERKGMTNAQWHSQHVIFEKALRAVMNCPIPIIAAVNGAAYGGGCEFACACDFIYASKQARFALPEVTLGIMPGAGGTQNLPRALGERRAKEIIMTGLPFSADEAQVWGLVNQVTSADVLLDTALNTARRIAENAPLSVKQIKQSIHRGLQMSVRDGLMFEIEAYSRLVTTADRQEGVLAYNEKRKPNFKGQ